jgi:hypothetical protein
MASGLQFERRSGMVTEMLSDLEMALRMSSESKLINWAHLFAEDPGCLIGSSSLLCTVLFATDVIAILE